MASFSVIVVILAVDHGRILCNVENLLIKATYHLLYVSPDKLAKVLSQFVLKSRPVC